MRRFSRVLVPVCVVTTSALQRGNIDPERLKRLFVVSDVHGDFDALVTAIHMAASSANRILPTRSVVELPDLESLKAVFANAIQDERFLGAHHEIYPLFGNAGQTFALVQMGDLIDRGDSSMRCLKAMELVAKVIGFEVVQLVGNHELMAVFDKTNPEWLNPNDDFKRNDESTRFLWEYIIENMVAMARIGGSTVKPLKGVASASAATLFVHAGISNEFIGRMRIPQGKSWSIDNFNSHMSKSMTHKDLIKLQQIFLHTYSPVWTRDMAEESTDCNVVDNILKHFRVERIIVGHSITTRDRQVELNCGGKVILTDNAMSAALNEDRTSLPTITVMDFSRGRLIGISAEYFGMEPPEILINSDGSPNKPSLREMAAVSDIRLSMPPVGVLLQKDGVTIAGHVYGTTPGILVSFASNDAQAHLIRMLRSMIQHKPHTGTPAITHLAPIESDDYDTYYFVASTATSMLPDGIGSTSTRHQIQYIFKYLSEIGLCLDEMTPPCELFGIDATGHVDLLNLSAVVQCGPN